MALGYLDHPPMVALLIWIGTHLFGNSETGVRLGAFLCWFITAWFSYRLTLSVSDRKIALNSLVLIAALPLFFGTALVITPDAPLIACWAGTLFFLHRALIDENGQSWFGVGICLGLGLVSKYTIVLLGPAILLFMLLDPRSRRWLYRPQPYLAAGAALLIFSPVIFWNYQHEWASFLFQSQRRIAGVFMFSTPELLGAILLLLTPTGLLAVWTTRHNPRKPEPGPAPQTPDAYRRHWLFALCMALVPLSVFVFFSFSREVKIELGRPPVAGLYSTDGLVSAIQGGNRKSSTSHPTGLVDNTPLPRPGLWPYSPLFLPWYPRYPFQQQRLLIRRRRSCHPD